MSIKILLADDHGLVRAGLRALLSAESDMEIIAEADNGLDAEKLVQELNPDVALIDINMPGKDGIEVTRSLSGKVPDTRILVTTVHEDESLLQEAIRAGAAGYIVKRAVESELIDAIKAVQRGDLYVHPTMTRSLLKTTAEPPSSNDAPLEDLTHRELDVLRLIAIGYTNRQMAEELSISVRTVEGYRANLMSKLDVHGRVELVSYARRHNLVDL